MGRGRGRGDYSARPLLLQLCFLSPPSPGPPGRKLSAVRVEAATARAPLVGLLAISLEASLVSKTQNPERGQQMTVSAEMSE